MKLKVVVVGAALTVCLLGCQNIAGLSGGRTDYPKSFTLSVQNPLPMERIDESVVLEVAAVKKQHPDFNAQAFIVTAGDNELASQAVDRDGDGRPDEIVFVVDVQADETRTCTVHYAKTGTLLQTYPKRTGAEVSHKVGGEFVDGVYQGGEFQNVDAMRVPPECTDHSLYIRYEGPGWESDKIGYRFYLDWRNAVDIYGKKTPDMVLQDVGLDGYESYHEMSDWGMDVLKVGDSLGVGSIGIWTDIKAERVAKTKSLATRIVADGPVYSQIETQYEKWNVEDGTYDLTADLSIRAGQRMTRCDLQISNQPANLCTGIVKLPNTVLLNAPAHDGDWTYMATYGVQSLAEDKLGMAVLYRKRDLIETTADALNHVVVLRPTDGRLRYYFLGAWEQEPNGITTADGFTGYLNDTIKKLDNPLKVEMK